MRGLLLSVESVSKRFGSRVVLDRVSFAVREGEVLGLIGPNGAGKTTLFECLAGLIHCESGVVKFRGIPLAATRRKSALFYLPDAIKPWADQRVSWALGFFGEMYGRSRTEIKELTSALGLTALTAARIGSLSKGELKRALVALGLLTRHELLLLDEPFDGMDLRQSREVMALLKSRASDGRTLFLSIHQLGDAALCDRVILLSAGLIAGEGTLEELREKAGLSEGGIEEVFLALT